MKIKKWFLDKNFSQSEKYAMTVTEPKVERETEKAKLIKWDTEFGIISSWIPKSCIEIEEVEEVEEKEIKVGSKVKTNKGTVAKVIKIEGIKVSCDNGKDYIKSFLEAI